VVILVNNGNGFAAAGASAVGNSPASITVADFNHDGNLDLAITAFDSNALAVCLGDGTGKVGPAHFSGTGVNPVSAAVGDVNRDGNPDLAVANSGGNSVSVFLGDGSGAFAPASGSPLAVGFGPHSVAWQDVNGDGRLDLLVAQGRGNALTALLGDGRGGLA